MINNLLYIENFISEQESEELVNNIDQQIWLTDLKRRVQHYGYKYDYTKKKIDQSMALGPLPDIFSSILHKINNLNIFTSPVDQIIINEYLPGQGISPHVDCTTCFGPVVISLSLLSQCIINFDLANKHEKILLKPLSLLILKDEFRYKWKHSISMRSNDLIDGNSIDRQKRISLTFRTVII